MEEQLCVEVRTHIFLVPCGLDEKMKGGMPFTVLSHIRHLFEVIRSAIRDRELEGFPSFL